MKFSAVLSLAAALTFAMSCSETRPKPVPAPLSLERQESLSAIVSGSNSFATDLYAKLAADKKGNLFFSPGSIDTALAMTYAGAGGDTAKQMEKTLHFTLSTDKLSVGYADLLDSLNSRRNNNWFEKPAYELLVANALWGQKGYEFKPAFTQLLQNNYGARLKDVDFAKTEQARKTINDWVAQQTKDKIKDLIPPGAVDNLTRLVLTNAIYFKGKWETKFAKEGTKDGQFKVTAEKSVDVPMMHQLHDFGYTENDDLQMLELPYIQNELSMVIMLPKKIDGLADLEKSLTAASVGKWLKEQRPTPVDVTLPKFTFSSEFMLKDTLKAMGMTDAFDGGKADFTGMTDKEKLFISKVIHKAFVAVDEEGTEAAAATAVVTTPTACPPPEEPKVFKADHPFMFLIRHNSTGEILFMGRVANPKGE